MASDGNPCRTPIHKRRNDRQRIDALTDVYEYANALTKTEVSGYALDGWSRTLHSAEDQAGFLIGREEKREAEREHSAFRDNLVGTIQAGDAATALDCVGVPRLAGKDKGSIRSSVTSRMKQACVAAYSEGDMEAVGLIEDTLVVLWLGFSIGTCMLGWSEGDAVIIPFSSAQQMNA